MVPIGQMDDEVVVVVATSDERIFDRVDDERSGDAVHHRPFRMRMVPVRAVLAVEREDVGELAADVDRALCETFDAVLVAATASRSATALATDTTSQLTWYHFATVRANESSKGEGAD